MHIEMHLRTLLMLLQYYISIQCHPEIMTCSGTETWQTSLTEPSTHNHLSLQILSVTEISYAGTWLHCSWYPHMPEKATEQSWENQGPWMKPVTIYCCHTCAIQWDYTRRSTTKTRASHTLWRDSLHLSVHQSHAYVMGVGWDNSYVTHEKKRILERCGHTNWACKPRHRLRS